MHFLLCQNSIDSALFIFVASFVSSLSEIGLGNEWNSELVNTSNSRVWYSWPFYLRGNILEWEKMLFCWLNALIYGAKRPTIIMCAGVVEKKLNGWAVLLDHLCPLSLFSPWLSQPFPCFASGKYLISLFVCFYSVSVFFVSFLVIYSCSCFVPGPCSRQTHQTYRTMEPWIPGSLKIDPYSQLSFLFTIYNKQRVFLAPRTEKRIFSIIVVYSCVSSRHRRNVSLS